MKVHHLGYLVENMDNAIKEFQELGYSIQQEKLYDPLRRVFLCFLENNGLLVELVSPAEGCKLFSKLQKRIGNAPYHICYTPPDRPKHPKNNDDSSYFSYLADFFQNKGFLMVQPPEPAIAFNGKKVSFFMSEAIGLIEVLEA